MNWLNYTCDRCLMSMAGQHILTDFKNATLISRYIFQNTVVCKIPLLASSANTLVLIVQLNWTT